MRTHGSPIADMGFQRGAQLRKLLWISTRLPRLAVAAAVLCLAAAPVSAAFPHIKKKPQPDPLADYLSRARQWSAEPAASPVSLWSPAGAFSNLFADYKAHKSGDLIIIQLAESTNSSQQAPAQTSRTFAASSAISEFFGTPGARSGIQNLFSPTSSQALNGKGQTSLTTTLQSTLSGTVVEVLPDGNMVVEAKRDVDVSNQKHTLIVRGIVRPGDISPTNTVLSTQVAHLEVELKGKGVISDSVRSPIAPLRLMLWILGF